MDKSIDIKEQDNNTLNWMKVILSFFVVFVHITVMFTYRGLFELSHSSNVYAYIANFFELIDMPAFVAVSGAVYRINKDKHKYYDHKIYFVDKIKRLLIPYMFFSVMVFGTLVYIGKFPDGNTLKQFIYAFVVGANCRHLWYLYMLFAVMIIYNFLWPVIVSNVRISTMVIIALFCISPYLPIEFQIQNIFYYLLFFHLGVIMTPLLKNQNGFVWIILCFLSLSTIFYFAYPVHDASPSIILKLLAGTIAFPIIYMICKYLSFLKIPAFLLRNTFGLYLFHPIYNYLIIFHIRDVNLHPIVIIVMEFFLISTLSILSSELLRSLSLQILIGEKKKKLAQVVLSK